MTDLITDAALRALPLPAQLWRYGHRFLDALVAAAVDARRPAAQRLGDPVRLARPWDHAEVIVLKGDSYRLRGKRQEMLTGEKKR